MDGDGSVGKEYNNMLSRPNNRIEGHPAAVDELNYGPPGRMERG